MTDDFEDSLDDLIGTPRAKPVREFKPALEKAEARQDFTERCMACGGSGKWRGFRTCFKCKGEGRLVFRTSPEARAKGRMRAEEKRELKAETDAQWREDHKAEIEWLNTAAERQHKRAHSGQSVWNFPIELTEKLAQYGTLTDGQLGAVHKLMLRDTERQQARDRQNAVDASKIEAAFASARAKAARPGAMGIWTKPLKLRAQDVDMAFQPGSEGSQWAGMIFVKAGDKKLGSIVSGVFRAKFECSDAEKAAVIEACEDPSKAAVAYGKAWSICAICGHTLTNDESIARGIGPICAENFGW